MEGMITMALNLIRHLNLFDPRNINTKITVIGAGATGSFVVLQLAKLGLKNIEVWDFDVVEEHNVPNQLFGLQHIGLPKVEALRDIVKEYTGTEIAIKNEAFTNQRLIGYVFLMVDSMKARKEIFESSIMNKRNVLHMIETRMGLDVGRIYNVDPNDRTQVAKYLTTLYSDEEATVSACGTSQTVITTAMSIASYATRQLINKINQSELDNEIMIDYVYNNCIPTRW